VWGRGGEGGDRELAQLMINVNSWIQNKDTAGM
jgi:hypothetical protein